MPFKFEKIEKPQFYFFNGDKEAFCVYNYNGIMYITAAYLQKSIVCYG